MHDNPTDIISMICAPQPLLRSLPLSEAHRIAAHPRASDSPQQRLLAWAHLKSARGQTIHQSRLRRMQRARRAS